MSYQPVNIFNLLLESVQTQPKSIFSIDDLLKDLNLKEDKIRNYFNVFILMGWIKLESKGYTDRPTLYKKNDRIYEVTKDNYYTQHKMNENYIFIKGILINIPENILRKDFFRALDKFNIPYIDIKAIFTKLINERIILKPDTKFGRSGYFKNTYSNQYKKIVNKKEVNNDNTIDNSNTNVLVKNNDKISLDDHTKVSNEEIIETLSELKMDDVGKCLFAYITKLDNSLTEYNKKVEEYKKKILELRNENDDLNKYMATMDEKAYKVKNNDKLKDDNERLKAKVEKLEEDNEYLNKQVKILSNGKQSKTVLSQLSELKFHRNLFRPL